MNTPRLFIRYSLLQDRLNRRYERWRWIPGYKGQYRVSSKGRVRSVDRFIHHWRGGESKIKGKMLVLSQDADGYYFVSLSKFGKWYPFRVHQLVLLAFVGPCPEGMECRHLDGNRQNNNLANLRWGTSKENGSDRIKHGTSKVNQGQKHGMTRLTDADVILMRKKYATGLYTQKELGDVHGITDSAACNAIHGVTWSHIKEGLRQ